MKSLIHRSYNGRFSSKNINILLNDNLIKENNISTNGKEQILFNRKSSLEALFNLIKYFQNEFFSKHNKTNKLKVAKEMLFILQNNLSLMKIEKKKQFDYLRIMNENNKKVMQDVLFSENQTKKVNNIENNDRNNCSYITKKKELKLINFQIENEIQKTDFILEQKSQIYLYVKSIPFFLDTNQEIFCNNNYDNLENISETLKNIRTSVKDIFISKVKEKMKTELEISTVSFQLNTLKENIINDRLNKKYIDTEEIIYEESRENNKTLATNQSKRNSHASLNKLGSNKIFNGSSKNVIRKHLSIDSLMRDKIYKNSIFSLCHKSNEYLNENKNQINNYLNMNINVNINVNNTPLNINNNYSTYSLEDENEIKSEDYDDHYENDLDDNDIINENINENDEDMISKEKNKRNNDIYNFETNNKIMKKLYNKSSDFATLGKKAIINLNS